MAIIIQIYQAMYIRYKVCDVYIHTVNNLHVFG